MSKGIDQVVCIVRVSTSYWSDGESINCKRTIRRLKRKSSGNVFDRIDDAEEEARLIKGFHSVEDGIYHLKVVNVSYDIESGYADDWDYELVPYK